MHCPSHVPDRPFLDFFFKRVEANTTGRHTAEFPYISRCGRELNFLRCDDTPLVFHALLPQSSLLTPDNHNLDIYIQEQDRQVNNIPYTSHEKGCTDPEPWDLVYAGSLRRRFKPGALCMTETGRLYHPGPKEDQLFLVASPLAIKLSTQMVFGTDKTIFTWQHHSYEIDIRIPEELDKA